MLQIFWIFPVVLLKPLNSPTFLCIITHDLHIGKAMQQVTNWENLVQEGDQVIEQYSRQYWEHCIERVA